MAEQSSFKAWFSILDSEWPAKKERFIAWLKPDNFNKDGTQKTSMNMTATIHRS